MTAVGSFTVGEVLTAASMNEIGAWTSFTPTIGGVTTSAKTGKYYKMNKIGFVYLNLTLSAAPTGTVTVDFPSAMTGANLNTADNRGPAMYYDSSAVAALQYYPIQIRAVTGSVFRFSYWSVSGAAINTLDITNTQYPILPASGDIISALWVGEVS